MREFVGKVVSNRMVKSVLVAVNRLKDIPKYKRRVVRSKKFMAHDEDNSCNIGDLVRIHMSRPISKRKSFRVTEIILKSKVYNPEEAAAKARQVIAEMEARKRETLKKQELNLRGFAASGAS